MAEANLGPLALKRWPHRRGDPLLPFDAADRYLLKQLDEHRRGPATLVLIQRSTLVRRPGRFSSP